MAILFSKVTLAAGDYKTSFLMSGIPVDQIDFEGWTAYEEFIKITKSENQVHAAICSYLYGEKEPVIATPEEVAYMHMRLDRRPDFLESRCQLMLESEFNFEI